MADRELFLIDGNSLAYRAFFALPESIATSRGEPTNAIFGFASMLVKILTEYGPKATIVVWDAGMSGREKEYEPYKAERKPRPDLLREQWPHLEPLVEAFGYENVRVEGYEADDVIASLAEQAKQAGIPVMIVTGDRDAYQLADERQRADHDHLARDHRHPRVRPRGRGRALRHPAGAGDRLHRAEGRHVGQHPGRPRHRGQDGRAAAAAVRVAREVLEHVDDISGEKRRQNLRENADLARISKSLATLHRGLDAGVDVAEIAGREPDRSRLREVFTRFELRDPLRRLEEALGEQEAAPRAAGERRIEADARETPPAGLAELGDAAALAVTREDGARPALGRARRRASRCSPARPRRSRRCWRHGANGPLVAHDWKALRRGAGDAEAAAREVRLSNDTMVAAYLIDPARRRYPLDELLDQAGIEPVVEGGDDAARGRGRGARAVRRPAGGDRPPRAARAAGGDRAAAGGRALPAGAARA